jgi:hypothetical protein
MYDNTTTAAQPGNVVHGDICFMYVTNDNEQLYDDDGKDDTSTTMTDNS